MGGFGSDGMGGFGGGGYATGMNAYHATIDTLGKIGPAAKRALPVLRKLLAKSREKKKTNDQTLGGGSGNTDLSVYLDATQTTIARIEGRVDGSQDATTPDSESGN